MIENKVEEEEYDGRTLIAVLNEAEKTLEKHIDELNKLNVFPVPDGDTGINMYVTLQAANKAIVKLETDSAAEISAAAARGALLGASGNSGVILSQILRGIAKAMEMKHRFSCFDFASALQTASEMAHRAVTKPVEGTIITVSREASEKALQMAKKGAGLRQIMIEVTKQAEETVLKTPELLPQLKEAGVVDAGGKGLFYVFQGMNSYISKHISKPGKPRGITIGKRKSIQHKQENTTSLRYGYDLQFLIRGNNLPLDIIRPHIESMGESVIVVGTDQIIRVHIHTKDSDRVLNYAKTHGEITDLVMENMDEQVKNFKRNNQ
jgi:uncharacterized protein